MPAIKSDILDSKDNQKQHLQSLETGLKNGFNSYSSPRYGFNNHEMAVYTTVMTVTELQSILCGWPSISNRSKIYIKYIKFCTKWISLA